MVELDFRHFLVNSLLVLSAVRESVLLQIHMLRDGGMRVLYRHLPTLGDHFVSISLDLLTLRTQLFDSVGMLV